MKIVFDELLKKTNTFYRSLRIRQPCSLIFFRLIHLKFLNIRVLYVVKVINKNVLETCIQKNVDCRSRIDFIFVLNFFLQFLKMKSSPNLK